MLATWAKVRPWRAPPGVGIRRYFGVGLVLTAWVVDLLLWSGHASDRHLRGGGLAPLWVVPVGTVPVFATLLLRRRYPARVFVVQLAWAGGTALAMPRYDSVAGVLIGLHAVAARYRPRRSLLAMLACAVPFLSQVTNGHHSKTGALPVANFVIEGILSMAAAAAAWGLGYRAWLADTRAAALTARAEADAAAALRAERLRIARELHDIVAHSVSVMVLHAAGAKATFTVDPGRSQRALDTITEVGGQAMGELRRLLGLLRSASGDQPSAGLEQQPGLKNLDALLDEARATGLTVVREIRGVPADVDPGVGLTAYRLVQEALTNTMKHAATRASVHIALTWSGRHLTVSVTDRRPADCPQRTPAGRLSTGHGLLGLRERVSTVGGTFDAHPTRDGFALCVVLPISQLPATHPPAGAPLEPQPSVTAGPAAG